MIFKDSGAGHTDRSINFFRENRNKLGEIIRVEMREYVDREGQPVDYPLRFYDDQGNQIWLTGCICGYGGEGPRGTYTLLQELDFDISLEEIKKFKAFTFGKWLNEL